MRECWLRQADVPRLRNLGEKEKERKKLKEKKRIFIIWKQNSSFGNLHSNFDFLIITKNSGGLAAMLQQSAGCWGPKQASDAVWPGCWCGTDAAPSPSPAAAAPAGWCSPCPPPARHGHPPRPAHPHQAANTTTLCTHVCSVHSGF